LTTTLYTRKTVKYPKTTIKTLPHHLECCRTLNYNILADVQLLRHKVDEN